MPSIRGYKRGIDSQALKQAVDKYTAHVATIAAKAGREAMRELRISAVERWYNSTANVHMNSATIVESDSPKQGDKKIEITIRSYVDIDKFEESKRGASSRNLFSSPYESVKSWRERHEVDGWQYYGRGERHPAIDMPYSIGEYLFKLPWEEGIFALPPHERHTGTGWVNPAKNVYKKDGSLEIYLKKDLQKKWARTVSRKFSELNK